MAQHHWEKLFSDEGAHFDREVVLHAAKLPPIVSWGTSPEQVVSVPATRSGPAEIADETKRKAAERSLDYMGLKGGEKITDIDARPRVHRLMHQWPHRGSARGG